MAEPPPPDLSFLGIKLIHFVAGGFGGLVRGLTKPSVSFTKMIGTGIVGALVAGYGTPVVAPITYRYLEGFGANIGQAEFAGMVGFMLGMTGLSVAEGVIRWARKWRDHPTLPPAPRC